MLSILARVSKHIVSRGMDGCPIYVKLPILYFLFEVLHENAVLSSIKTDRKNSIFYILYILRLLHKRMRIVNKKQIMYLHSYAYYTYLHRLQLGD